MVNSEKEMHPAKGSTAVDQTEFFYLRMKNKKLAKQLSEVQDKCTQMTRERNFLQEALFNEKIRANEHSNKLNDVAVDLRTALSHLVALSSCLTDVISKLAQNNVQAGPVLENKIMSSPQKQKTKAVKPMVSGCTISKPTIKLNRISDQFLQAVVNGESSTQREPVVNVTRLPERLNLEELQEQMDSVDTDEEQETDAENGDDFQENTLPQPLSIILESTEQNSRSIRNLTVAQLNSSENSTTPRFTSTPRVKQHVTSNTSEASTSSPSVASTSNTSSNIINSSSSITDKCVFVTKRAGFTSIAELKDDVTSNTSLASSSNTSSNITNNSSSSITDKCVFVRKREVKVEQETPKSPKTTRHSRRFSPGSPRVLLKRLNVPSANNGNVKLEKMSPVKRSKRAAASNVSYKEPPLHTKLRRNK